MSESESGKIPAVTSQCHCCGGDMPDPETWEERRGDCTADCDGSVDLVTGRCRAWADDALWLATYDETGETDEQDEE